MHIDIQLIPENMEGRTNMKNAYLVIQHGEQFANDIWQDDDDFSENDWKEAVTCFADTLQSIYDWLNEEEAIEEVDLPFDPYVLGDTINMLRSIGVVKA